MREIYLAACAASLALASLNLLMLPTLPLWRLSVVTTEFGHWVAVPVAALLGWGLCHLSLGWPVEVGGVLAAGALFVFLLPLREARRIASRLPASLEEAFGPLPEAARAALPPPLSFLTLLFGRKTPPVRRESFTYAMRGEQALRIEFHRSVGDGPSPCVVVVHGGGWSSGSPEEGVEFDGFLARRGYAVAAVQYRLAPEAIWPASRDDLLEALRVLKERAGEWNIDPERIVLFGRSAGGQIASSVACHPEGAPIRGCIALYAPSDMHFSYRYAKPGDILDSPRLLTDYLGGTPDAVPAQYDDASPLIHVDPKTPPFLLLHGRHDPLVWFLQSERLAARLRWKGVPSHYLDLHWATHAFDYDRRTPGGQLHAYAVLYFLAARTAPR